MLRYCTVKVYQMIQKNECTYMIPISDKYGIMIFFLLCNDVCIIWTIAHTQYLSSIILHHHPNRHFDFYARSWFTKQCTLTEIHNFIMTIFIFTASALGTANSLVLRHCWDERQVSVDYHYILHKFCTSGKRWVFELCLNKKYNYEYCI